MGDAKESEMSETFAEKIARQIAEKTEKAAQDEKDEKAKVKERIAKSVEADLAALRLRVTALVSEYQGIIERIAEHHSEDPISKRTTKFCIFTHFSGTFETLKEEVKPLLDALEGSGFQPILLSGDSGSALYDATGRTVSATMLQGVRWDAQIDAGHFIKVSPTPDPKLSKAQQRQEQARRHEEIGWLDARTAASFYACKYGTDTLSIGARW